MNMDSTKWFEEDPTIPGWYWIANQSYIGSERFGYRNLRLVYVQIRKESINDGPVFTSLETFSAFVDDKPAIRCKECDDGLGVVWMGPVAAPEMPTDERKKQHDSVLT